MISKPSLGYCEISRIPVDSSTGARVTPRSLVSVPSEAGTRTISWLRWTVDTQRGGRGAVAVMTTKTQDIAGYRL